MYMYIKYNLSRDPSTLYNTSDLPPKAYKNGVRRSRAARSLRPAGARPDAVGGAAIGRVESHENHYFALLFRRLVSQVVRSRETRLSQTRRVTLHHLIFSSRGEIGRRSGRIRVSATGHSGPTCGVSRDLRNDFRTRRSSPPTTPPAHPHVHPSPSHLMGTNFRMALMYS